VLGVLVLPVIFEMVGPSKLSTTMTPIPINMIRPQVFPLLLDFLYRFCVYRLYLRVLYVGMAIPLLIGSTITGNHV
jgi:hypothetical protein